MEQKDVEKKAEHLVNLGVCFKMSEAMHIVRTGNYEERLNLHETQFETQKHILRVGDLIKTMIGETRKRIANHDRTKLLPPEVDYFAKYTHMLKDLTYGTEEYNQCLKDMKPAIDHHYESNSHHPEHYENGVDDMDLVDIVEMICDWKAASERHDDGDIFRSIEINKKRFNISPQLERILINTCKRFLTKEKNVTSSDS